MALWSTAAGLGGGIGGGGSAFAGGLVVEDDVVVGFALMTDEDDVEATIIVYVDDLGIARGAKIRG